jgi:phosphate transport system permease protein
MSAVGAAPGDQPLVPPGQAVRGDSLFRRIANAIRANEEHGWRLGARVAIVLPLAALVFALVVLAHKAWPAVQVNGWSFLTGSKWTYGQGYGATVHKDGVALIQGETFQAWPIIAGTLLSSLFAVIIAVPISIGAAFALTERLPEWVSRPLGFAIELLAGIPSVVIGLWGVLTLGPILARHVYPIVGNNMPNVPILRFFKGPVYYGEGLATASIVLALMIVPIITSTTRDLFVQVPPLPKEGASALGMTDLEVARRVTVPWVRSGIIGAVVLGLGRALGETIAVALIGGAALRVPHTVFSNFTTIAATILQQLDGAQTDGTGFAVATLAELAIVLAIIVVVVNLAARMVITRASRLGGPVGSGA